MNSPPRRLRTINLIPLINVVFLLLTFFLVAGTIAPRLPLSVEFPEAESPNTPPKQSVHVTINKDGTIAFEEHIVSMTNLPTLLVHELGEFPNQPILIQADKNLPASQLTDIISLFEAAGANNIKLMTMGYH